jgi:hypothetical protein
MLSLTECQLSSPQTGPVCRDFRRAFRFSSSSKKYHNEEHAAAGLTRASESAETHFDSSGVRTFQISIAVCHFSSVFFMSVV